MCIHQWAGTKYHCPSLPTTEPTLEQSLIIQHPLLLLCLLFRLLIRHAHPGAHPRQLGAENLDEGPEGGIEKDDLFCFGEKKRGGGV